MYDSLKCFSPEELSYLAATLAVTFAQGLDDAEICILGNLLFSIKVNLDLIAKQRIFNTEYYKALQLSEIPAPIVPTPNAPIPNAPTPNVSNGKTPK
jgi:hypothetical protein